VVSPIDLIAQLFAGEGVRSYLGEEVSLATHMLQAAALAESSAASEHLVVASLLHDVGHFEAIGRGDHRHEDSGADWLAQWFPAGVSEPVRLHVTAKRYLCAVEPGYHGRLSQASIHPLRLQGGPLTQTEAEAFTKLPYALDAVAVRRWDEAAKDPTVTTLPFEHFRSLLEQIAT
jgi:gamma-butyrobetaine dioxygenase